MSGRERMLTALSGHEPDRAPVSPDVSLHVAVRQSGRPFWALQLERSPPVWKACLDVIRSLGLDGWLPWGQIDYELESETHPHSSVVERTDAQWTVRTVLHTPDGELTQTAVCARDAPVTFTERYIKDLDADFIRVRHLFADVRSYDDTTYHEQREALGGAGVVAVWAATPGPQSWAGLFHGGIPAAVEECDRHPDLARELAALYERHTLQRLEVALEVGVDCVFTGFTGPATPGTAELESTLSLPSIRRISSLCREADVPCGLCVVGATPDLVDACLAGSGVSWLAGAAGAAGTARSAGVARMGGVPADTLRGGSPAGIRRACLEALLTHGPGGGYVLSGDEQCHRDTPLENLRVMVAVGAEHGGYPLDTTRIREEIDRLTPSS